MTQGYGPFVSFGENKLTDLLYEEIANLSCDAGCDEYSCSTERV